MIHKNQGFTLVELAIVIIIIGLLLGGVLQGRELIEQAKIRNNIKRISEINAATVTFYGKYEFLPGDLPSALSTPVFGFAGYGNGDGQLSWLGNQDSYFFWSHLEKAQLINVVRTDGNAFSGLPGPTARFRYDRGKETTGSNTGVGIMYATTGDIYKNIYPSAVGIDVGNVITITTFLSNGFAAYSTFTSDETRVIDEKIDDGNAITGKFRGADGYSYPSFNRTACSSAGIYTNNDSDLMCRILFELGV